ncbi:transmembrane protein 116 [Lampris incognitus]|uniref:transmembrane protein 116 n=1 Tax=Lampris incognitus TaxID=2546036 RepID=UPI0024B50991|nr:transmembrane protein 116 [Lampris incognitus]
MSSALSPEVIFCNGSQQNTTGAVDWTSVYEAVRWIQLMMAVLSILGSTSILVYITSQRLASTPELQPLFLLSVSDFLLALSWLVGAAVFTRDFVTNASCYQLHTVEQILYMSSFLYTLNYVWTIYTGIRRKMHCSINGFPVQPSSRLTAASKITASLSGLVPVLLMTPVLIEGNLSHCYANFSQPYRCLLMHTEALYLDAGWGDKRRDCSRLHTYHVTVFLTTFLFTLSGIMMFLGKARHLYRRIVTSAGYLGDRQWASFRLMDRRMFLYPSVFVLCWGPAVYLAVMKLYWPTALHGLAGVIIYIAQAVTSRSQGFLNCLVYGWTNRLFRSASKRTSSKDVDTQTPLLQSQKKSYQTLLDRNTPPHHGPTVMSCDKQTRAEQASWAVSDFIFTTRESTRVPPKKRMGDADSCS